MTVMITFVIGERPKLQGGLWVCGAAAISNNPRILEHEAEPFGADSMLGSSQKSFDVHIALLQCVDKFRVTAQGFAKEFPFHFKFNAERRDLVWLVIQGDNFIGRNGF